VKSVRPATIRRSPGKTSNAGESADTFSPRSATRSTKPTPVTFTGRTSAKRAVPESAGCSNVPETQPAGCDQPVAHAGTGSPLEPLMSASTKV